MIMANSLIVLNSIKYNDNLIKLELDESYRNGVEIKYEIDKPEDSESTFSQFLQEYVDDKKEEIILPDGE